MTDTDQTLLSNLIGETVPCRPVVIDDYLTPTQLAEQDRNSRLTAAVNVLLDCLAEDNHTSPRIDRVLIDDFIARIDGVLSQQMDAILHHPDFQALEANWRGLEYLVQRSDVTANSKIDILDITKQQLQDDFDDVIDITQSHLYKLIYQREYDTPGGEPVTAMLGGYYFSAEAADVKLLDNLSKVAASAHCPFISAVNEGFFHKDSFDDVMKMDSVTEHFDRAEYIHWRSFREQDDARYVGLVMPRFLLRMPYDHSQRITSFVYNENVKGADHHKYLWGNACFAFGANLAKSFKDYGWTVNIRGPESGGKVEGLPIHQFNQGIGLETKIPTEIIIPETREIELANLGLIPLSYYKNSDYACFFSANSTQLPQAYYDDEAMSNSRVNARLPYVFLVSRIGHYLKVLQRENIGSNKSATELENELNTWLKTLVTKMNNPEPALIATHPLREAHVAVRPKLDNPGFYHIDLFVMPHFQVEGLDVRLSLVSQLPSTNQ
tara:strand:+ start:14069 stop:15550 length:1482 start_codon:yes stop_codon:yes gene_type:complete